MGNEQSSLRIPMIKASASLLCRVAVLGAIGGLNLPAMGTIVFDLDTIISSSGTPAGNKPWLRATLSQVNPTTVAIKMEALNLSSSPSSVEAVKEWAFNINPTINVSQLSATESARTGSFSPSPLSVLSSANGYGGFSFDFDFEFSNAGGPNGGVASRFTQGDSVTVHVARAAGLLVGDFNFAADHGGRSFYTGAHIISLAGGKSAFVGDQVVVPEPSTYVAGGLALLPLLFGLRSRLVKKD